MFGRLAVLLVLVACAPTTTPGTDSVETRFTHTECLPIAGCELAARCCEGTEAGTDRCWTFSSAGEWDCISTDDCDAAIERAVIATCYPTHTGDTSLDTGAL